MPTVGDRIAQTVVAAHLERRVEPAFHPDSYVYRPRRSALDAVGVCRRSCWEYNWVIDFDIRKFFDSVRWDLVLKAVEAHRRPLGDAVCEAVAGRSAAAARRVLAHRCLEQAETIAQIVSARTPPDSRYVITGDMNDRPTSPRLVPFVDSTSCASPTHSPIQSRPDPLAPMTAAACPSVVMSYLTSTDIAAPEQLTPRIS
jgi:hypothetical protein